MISTKKSNNYVNIIIDMIVVTGAFNLAWFINLNYFIEYSSPEIHMKPFYLISLCIIPLHLVLYGLYHLYNLESTQRGWREILNICKANIISVLIFLFVKSFIIRFIDAPFYPDFFITIFFFLNTFMMIIVRKGWVGIRHIMKESSL